ncbi:heterokaryon incompatibility protein-domain-containing protein [Leptodontidium sp. 2 PMI_412]|nr:heterokaryon incompatibility protein-domain-containing protein [Leptodontidium sp. 2 PMI_412]
MDPVRSITSPEERKYRDDQEEQPKSTNPLLCQRCQIWDNIWTWVYRRTKDDPISLQELSRKTNCLMCRILGTMIETRRGNSETLRVWPPESPFRIDSSDPTKTTIRLLLHLEVTFLSNELELDETLAEVQSEYSDRKASKITLTPQLCFNYSADGTPHLTSIEPWEIPVFDVSLLKTWLRGCETVHGSLCVGESHIQIADLPLGFRVIDVCAMHIVKPSASMRFIALSYMWPLGGDTDVQLEKKNLQELETPGGLINTPLPNIISDSIALCRDLGENYLWIDRLCIVQDDVDEKPAQIAAMDKIYRSASSTIVAALNTRGGTGLPGTKGQPRESSIWTPPRDGEVEGRGIKPNGMTAIVQPSLWNKRGWTFQERILSRRRLFITESQVIFECSRGKAYEELTYLPQQPREAREEDPGSPQDPETERAKQFEEQEWCQIPAFSPWSRYDPDHDIDFNMKSSTSLVDYFHWVEDYTSRQLSYDSDILNAFAGVGNFLTESLNSRLIFGLPERYLPQTLMWSCLGPAERRTEMPQIPSWSWASSTKRSDYKWIAGSSTFVEHMVRIASLAYFYFQDPDLGLRKLAVREQWIENEVAMKDIENNDEVLELPGKYMPSVWRTKQTWQECPQNPWKAWLNQGLDPRACNAAASLPGSLLFNTTVATLKLGHDTRDIYKNEDPLYRDASICTSDNIQVGWLNKMSRDWIEMHIGDDKLYEFIVICGALADWRSRKTLVQYFKEFDLWRMHAMLVERIQIQREAFIARRVGVGVVDAHKWKDCNPRWETVVLC